MKNKIKEVQDYFINRITACDFDYFELSYEHNGWFHVKTIIDDLNINFGINIENEYYCSHDGDLKVEVPNDRLLNLISLISLKRVDFILKKIENIKSELLEIEKKF
jgi:hypothetical protein